MLTLALIASACCVVLIAAAVALGWSLRRETPAAGGASFRARKAKLPEPARPHPRMDLAAGIVPVKQAIRHRPRPRWVADVERQAVAASAFQRADWAYYNEDMGDLSDPGVRHRSGNVFDRRTGTLAVPEPLPESVPAPSSR